MQANGQARQSNRTSLLTLCQHKANNHIFYKERINTNRPSALVIVEVCHWPTPKKWLNLLATSTCTSPSNRSTQFSSNLQLDVPASSQNVESKCTTRKDWQVVFCHTYISGSLCIEWVWAFWFATLAYTKGKGAKNVKISGKIPTSINLDAKKSLHCRGSMCYLNWGIARNQVTGKAIVVVCQSRALIPRV